MACDDYNGLERGTRANFDGFHDMLVIIKPGLE